MLLTECVAEYRFELVRPYVQYVRKSYLRNSYNQTLTDGRPNGV